MKKTILLIAAAAILAACSNKGVVQLIPAENFDTTVDGQQVSLYTLSNANVIAQITNFGARVVSLWIPDRDGNMDDIELGFDNIQAYLDDYGDRFLGATIGPFANRIGDGRFSLDGKDYELPQNDNGQTLHGGLKGLDFVVWDVEECNDTTIVLSYVHPDGQDGFPGNLHITQTYTLTSYGALEVTHTAETDAPTVCNLSFHPFFNLKGEGKGTILDNVVVINADATTPVDEFLIPTGEIADVTGTPFDFREPHTIGERIEEDNDQLHKGPGYDHNWILNRRTPADVEFAASVYEPKSGRLMEIFTDQPGLQFYSGNFFDGTVIGKHGLPFNRRECFALETQKFPDSPNKDNFPTTVLRPGETYTHTAIYKFSVK